MIFFRFVLYYLNDQVNHLRQALQWPMWDHLKVCFCATHTPSNSLAHIIGFRFVLYLRRLSMWDITLSTWMSIADNKGQFFQTFSSTFFEIQISSAMFGFSMKNALHWIQSCHLLLKAHYFIRHLLMIEHNFMSYLLLMAHYFTNYLPLMINFLYHILNIFKFN